MKWLFGWLAAIALGVAGVHEVHAGTRVRITMPVGTVVLELFDDEKPVTVQNFLRYVEESRFTNTFSHRLIPGFIIQGGGWYLDGTMLLEVETFPPIPNEFAVGPLRSNVAGTIAMAKIAGQPDSATSGWFINLVDNSAQLDVENEGFTVFGQVIEGWEVLAALNADFADADEENRVVRNASGVLGGDFGTMPLMIPSLTVESLLFTVVEILPPEAPPLEPLPKEKKAPIEPLPEVEEVPMVIPTVKVVGPKSLRTPKAAVVLKGRAIGDVVRVEWRIGRNGKFRSASGTNRWKLRAWPLKPGRNMIFLRGVAETGEMGRPQRVRVFRER